MDVGVILVAVLIFVYVSNVELTAVSKTRTLIVVVSIVTSGIT